MLHKEVPSEGLSEKVGRLVSRVDREDTDEARLDPLPEMVILLIDVPSARPHLGSLSQADGASIVFKQFAVDSGSGYRNVDSIRSNLLEEVCHDTG